MTQSAIEYETTATRPALVRQLLANRAFLVAAGVLLVAAAGLNLTVNLLKMHFRKLPVPIRAESLEAIPEVVGSWVAVAKTHFVDADLIEALGATHYVFRDYINASAIPSGSVKSLQAEFDPKGMDWKTRMERVSEYRRRYPSSVITVGITYYTGQADTVAHVPERCYLADGWNEVSSQTRQLGSPDARVPFRHVTFESSAPTAFPIRNVAYTFHVNGRFTEDNLEVRRALQNLLQKHGYYCKVELMSVVDNRAEAESAMSSFMASLRPHFEKIMPDWEQYRSR